ncbi:hypothetical protein AU193_17235 [Mycobacterium sp. GA-1285]|uniref:sugar 3,4-ketoisomerase n=1 Tax=Mycobacterium sp. GA-1285 TaxID=1772282 RepID=UPI00074672AA|nr:FdtA/QdtA family cupin domain-containing protein [Mycobacterium sp. GA-1285]KUI20274.1 hypothetical protein AU193_17235 [Mycobacterium sp. GA-1285]
MSRVDECKLVNLDKIESLQGSLSPIYGGVNIPFAIKRVYYLYDVPGGAERGGHAHRALEQFFVAASGSFSVRLDDGYSQRSVVLDRSYLGLYVPRLIWRDISDFCTGAVCLVFASLLYDEQDYIHDYQEFVDTVRGPAIGDEAERTTVVKAANHG